MSSSTEEHGSLADDIAAVKRLFEERLSSLEQDLNSVRDLRSLLSTRPPTLTEEEIKTLRQELPKLTELKEILLGFVAPTKADEAVGKVNVTPLEKLEQLLNEGRALKADLEKGNLTDDIVRRVKEEWKRSESETQRIASQEVLEGRKELARKEVSEHLQKTRMQYWWSSLLQVTFALLGVAAVPSTAAAIIKWKMDSITAIVLCFLAILACLVCNGILAKNLRSSRQRLGDLEDKHSAMF